MADQYGRIDPKRYLPQAIVTTLAVILVPTFLMIGVILVEDPNPPLFLTTGLAIVLALLTVAAGSAWWLRRPESSEISFGDLMIWEWWRRKRAEDQLAQGTRLLGLDRSGHPRMHQTVSREQQVHVLRELTFALEAKDPYTHGHSRRVERHVYRTAMAMGLASADIDDLRKAAALHDVGKIRVPDRILRKAETLSSEERGVLEDHVLVGAWMVSSAGNADVVSAVRHHHEKWDGSGYPDGLRGTEIPLFARIIAVSDTFDAITSTRPYRAGADRDRAVQVLRAEAGRQFDPAVVDAFIKTLPTPVPAIASILVFLAGPRALLSRSAVLLKRAGAGALAPAAGATGAVILAGASTFAPPPIHHPAPPLRVAAQHARQGAPAPQRGPAGTSRPRAHPSPKREPNKAPTDRRQASPSHPAIVTPSQTVVPTASPTPQPTPSTSTVTPAVDVLTLSPTVVTGRTRHDQTLTANATAAGEPAEGATVLFSVTGSTVTSGSCTTDASGACSFTYTGPRLPGVDTVTACADVNLDGVADAGEPCGTATVTWVRRVPVVHAQGNGKIANLAGRAKIHFHFNIRRVGRRLLGTCSLSDSTAGVDMELQCVDLTSFTPDHTHITITGDAEVASVSTSFQIDAVDNGKPGKGVDVFKLQTGTGYSASGVLLSGNVKVHRHWRVIAPDASSPSPTPSPTS